LVSAEPIEPPAPVINMLVPAIDARAFSEIGIKWVLSSKWKSGFSVGLQPSRILLLL
jgi:hypothetical protein